MATTPSIRPYQAPRITEPHQDDAILVDRLGATVRSVTLQDAINALDVSADAIVEGISNKVLSATERTKLQGIASGATANAPNATLLSRANHTGTQPASTISGLDKTAVGLGNVSNTADADKPVSTAQATAIAAAAGVPAAGGTFTGAIAFSAAPPRITSAQVGQDGYVMVDMAGADATGTTSASTAIQTCLDKVGSTTRAIGLRFSGGSYLISTGLSLAMGTRGLVLDGGGATLKQNCATMFSLTGSQSRRLKIKDFDLLNMAANSVAFSISYMTGLRIENVNGGPDGNSSYWGATFDLTGVLEATMEGGTIKNTYNGAHGSDITLLRGVMYKLNGQDINHALGKVLALGFAYGLYSNSPFVPGIEGIFCTDCSFIQNRIGVFFKNTGYTAPGFSWTGGHIEAYEKCLHLEGIAQARVVGSLLYRNLTPSIAGQHVLMQSCIQSAVNDCSLDTVNSGSQGGGAAVHFAGGTQNSAKGNRANLPSDVNIAYFSDGTNTTMSDNEAAGAGLSGTGVTITGGAGATNSNRIF